MYTCQKPSTINAIFQLIDRFQGHSHSCSCSCSCRQGSYNHTTDLWVCFAAICLCLCFCGMHYPAIRNLVDRRERNKRKFREIMAALDVPGFLNRD